MCGIFGLVSSQSRLLDLAPALAKLRHRGPDDTGTLLWRPGCPPATEATAHACVALGHRRLSIIDLTPSGHQPMSSQDGRWHMVYNGEVYNYRELRSELESTGHQFRSHSDTEVVLAALAAWGPERALPRFQGMFALALLDVLEQRLLLARDPFGIKPLFLCRWRDGVAFSSEIPPLLALPGVSRELDAERTWHYLGYGVTDHGAGSLLASIRQLPMGSWSSCGVDNPEPIFSSRRYWDPIGIEQADIGFEESVTRFREVFLDSVALHLRSDVPVGCALSGGLDSSAIVCAIRHLNPKQEIHTFSYRADEARLDEGRWADLVNAQVGAIAHPVRPDAEALSADLDRLISTQGEPFGSTSMFAQSEVFRAAHAAGITVMLDGQGADELLGGYDLYQGARLVSLLRQGRLGRAWHLGRAQSAWAGRGWKTILATATHYALPPGLLPLARKLVGRGTNVSWIRPAWFRERGVTLRYPFQCRAHHDQLRRALQENVGRYGLPQLLRYEDRNSMAWSIESRVPFLTTPIASLLLSLPEEHLIGDDGCGKRVLRAAMRGIVPDAVLDRRDKIGFATPEAAWLTQRPDLTEDAIAGAADIPCLDAEGVGRTCRGILSGRRRFDFLIWRLINFVRWHRQLHL